MFFLRFVFVDTCIYITHLVASFYIHIGSRYKLVWLPDPSVMRMRGRGKMGLGNKYTLTRAMNKKSWNVKKVLESLVPAAILTCARK